jgi:hypothetical protein
MQRNLQVAVCFWNRDYHASLRNDSLSKAMDDDQTNCHEGAQRVTIHTIRSLILCFMPKSSR